MICANLPPHFDSFLPMVKVMVLLDPRTHMEMGLVVEGQKKIIVGKMSTLFNVQNTDCSREEIYLCWLRGNQFVDHAAVGVFCCIFNSLT